MRTIEEISREIQKLREGRGMSQKELADKVGVTEEQIKEMEDGRGIPRIDLFSEISKVLNISYDDLLGVPIYLRQKAKILANKPKLAQPTLHNLNYSKLIRLEKDIEKTADKEFLAEIQGVKKEIESSFSRLGYVLGQIAEYKKK